MKRYPRSLTGRNRRVKRHNIEQVVYIQDFGPKRILRIMQLKVEASSECCNKTNKLRTEWNGVEVKEPGAWFLNYPDFYDGLVDVACTDERGVGHIGFEDCQCAGLSREYGLGFVIVEDAVIRDVELAFGQAAE